MSAPERTLNQLKRDYGLRLLSLYGVFFSLNDWPWLEMMYSCESFLNICDADWKAGVASSAFVIYLLHATRLLAYVSLFFHRSIRASCLVILIVGFYFARLNGKVFSPDIAYVHFLVFAILLGSRSRERFFQDVQMPFSIVIYLSYTFSGFYKLLTPHWVEGTFFSQFLRGNHLLRSWADPIALSPATAAAITYLALYGEALAFLAIFNRFIRRIIWFVLTGIHVGMLMLADIPEVSLGMLCVHFFLMDREIFGLLRKTLPRKDK